MIMIMIMIMIIITGGWGEARVRTRKEARIEPARWDQARTARFNHYNHRHNDTSGGGGNNPFGYQADPNMGGGVIAPAY